MSRKNNISLYVLSPLIVALCLATGLLIGSWGNSGSLSPSQEKFNRILSIIASEYVDDLNIDDLIEGILPDLLNQLDPHSEYIPASDLTAVNEDLNSSFSGVGVSFQIVNDTVTVLEVISGGPADKVGIINGDRIVAADTVALTGSNITSDDVFKNLRGKKGTKVTLKIKRGNSNDLLTYDVVRGDIPVSSIDASYMADEQIGYVKVGKFARNTYMEFLEALSDLKEKGAEKFIIDLRGNAGGFMDQAIYMANEFLPAGRLIVYTKGRNMIDETKAVSDGSGRFQDSELVVITNEYSASASEIFAGAIQDNDRGLVIGRRTFGKGLVQNQTELPDKSAIRLTVARYYTPSGRSIQKEYDRGKNGKYNLDILDRYNHGEFYSSDSIKLDTTKKFLTIGGRTVYGGGGIMPDIFVPEDTTGYSSWYASVVNGGLVQKFAFDFTDRYRELLKKVKSYEQLKNIIPSDDALIKEFADYATKNGVPARWYYINQSRELALEQIKGFIVRDALGMNEMFKVINQSDPTIIRAAKALKSGESPIVIKDVKKNK